MEIFQGLREKPIPATPKEYNNEPDNRPTINQVVTKLNAIISNENVQLLNVQKKVTEIPENNIDNSLHGELSQIIQNFNNITTEELVVSISLVENNNSGIIADEIILLLEDVEIERKKPEFVNYLNDHNITSQEFYNWLLYNQDNSKSVYLLGIFNHFGIEINVDKQKAFKLYQNVANSRNLSGYQIAANLGSLRGTCNLGYCYEKGVGTSINKQKAFELFQKAANLGNLHGICYLGYCYESGIGTSIDKQKAFELYQNAANLGNANGICNLGCCYENGIGTRDGNGRLWSVIGQS
ncbi:hypothetical protein C1646_778279 [Rhizophagus diaphanus]|nr:hypothetical protein C1646_778279 [Rhizophagus diaphanus] [Rhizophagus sp. MUCL 43196]